jgi:hypothetical protein
MTGTGIIPARVVCRSDEACQQFAESIVSAHEPGAIVLGLLVLTIVGVAFDLYRIATG